MGLTVPGAVFLAGLGGSNGSQVALLTLQRPGLEARLLGQLVDRESSLSGLEQRVSDLLDVPLADLGRWIRNLETVLSRPEPDGLGLRRVVRLGEPELAEAPGLDEPDEGIRVRLHAGGAAERVHVVAALLISGRLGLVVEAADRGADAEADLIEALEHGAELDGLVLVGGVRARERVDEDEVERILAA